MIRCGYLRTLTGATLLAVAASLPGISYAVYYPSLTYTSVKTLAPGVIHKKANLPSPNNNINLFIIDPTAGGAMVVPTRPAGTNGLSRTSTQGAGAKAIAAINAGFFGSGGRNITKKDSIVLPFDSTVIANGNSAMGFSGMHQKLPLRLQINAVGDPSSTSQPGASQWNQMTDFIGGRGHATATNGVVTITNETSDAGHYASRHPRTAIGYSESPYRIILCTVDGRSAGGSLGMTFQEHGQLMADLGCSQILFLDGGGSTTAWTKLDGVVNNFSDASERSVNSTWTVIPGTTVDNRDTEFTVAGGGWSATNHADSYDRNHRVAAAGAAGRTAKWQPNLAESGRYEVYVRWVADATRSTVATYTVNHRGGSNNVNVNQTNTGTAWSLLGTYNFNGGSGGSVVLNATNAANSYSADVVRFTRIGDATAAPASPGKNVTVSKTAGAANFQTIQDAVDSFPLTDPNPNVPNVITVLDSSVYEETLTINRAVRVQGATGQRPVIAVRGNGLGRSANSGIMVNLPSSYTTGTVSLENFVIIPSRSTSHGKLTSAIENKNNNVFLYLNNLLIAPNDGTDAPLVTDGYTDKTAAFDADQAVGGANKYLGFGDDGLYLGYNTGVTEGQGLEVLMRNTIISHIRAGDTVNQDGLVAVSVWGTNPNTRRSYRIEDGCAFSYCGRIGMQITGDLVIDSPSRNTLVIGNGSGAGTNPGIWLANSLTKTSPVIRGVVFVNNKGEAIRDSAIAGGYRAQISNTKIFGTGLNSILVEGAATRPMTIRNSTIVRGTATGSFGPISIASGANCPLTITDSVIGGHQSLTGNTANVVANGGTGTVTLQGTALITQGPWALRSPGITGTFTGSASTNANPLFVNTGNYPALNLDVTNGLYSNANSTNGGLGGGASYIGPLAEAEDWELY